MGCGFDFTDLGTKREAMRASKQRDPVVVAIGDKEFLLGRVGKQSGYPLRLDNPEQGIQCGEFNSPSFFVTYRSHGLWHKGAKQLPEIDFDEDCFVTLASKDGKHRKDRKVQMFRFGEGDIVLRVYDKIAEIRESSQKTWFYELWGGVTEIVWRLEFQVRKELLKRFGLRPFAD